MVETILISELKKLENVNIIDVRSIEKYNNGHINNAINIPFEKLLINFNNYLSKYKKYYIYCQKGVRSKKMCQILENAGFDVVNIIGGYEAWILENEIL